MRSAVVVKGEEVLENAHWFGVVNWDQTAQYAATVNDTFDGPSEVITRQMTSERVAEISQEACLFWYPLK